MRKDVSNAISRNSHLDQLERWARQNLPEEHWNDEVGKRTLVNYCYLKWNASESRAKNYANIVTARLVALKKPVLVPDRPSPLSVEEEEGLSVSEIITAYKRTEPPVPKDHFSVVEEE